VQYEDTSRAFYKGLAELQVGLLEDANRDFVSAATLTPAEPASWANAAIARLRLGDIETAGEAVAQALLRAPRNADIALLSAQFETARGQLDRAVAELRRAVGLDPRHLRARFALAEELERAGSDAGDMEATALLDDLQRLAPANLAVSIERARVAAKHGDTARLDESIARLRSAAVSWPPEALAQLDPLARAAELRNYTEAARATVLLRNTLARVPAFTSDLTAIRTSPELIAEPFDQFIALTRPTSTPAAPDTALAFSAEPLDPDAALAVAAFSSDSDDQTLVFVANGSSMRRLDASRQTWSLAPGSSPRTLLPLDWNNDFRTDLLVAGSGGVRLLLQRESGTFEDATAAASAGAPVSCACIGAWAADIEMDGDLDVVLGVAGGPVIVLRNNGDGTWNAQNTFAAMRDVAGFAWTDLDRDGDPDAAFLTGTMVRVLLNGRAGSFTEVTSPGGLTDVNGMTAADIDADGRFDLIVHRMNGTIHRASLRADAMWDERPLLETSVTATQGTLSMIAADLDNNGAIDLAWNSGFALADEHHAFQSVSGALPGAPAAAVDFDGDGLLDLVVRTPAPTRLRARSARGYHWKRVRLRAQSEAGDQRINPFAVGGEVEVRAGLLYQKQLLTGGPAHFGLGSRTSIDVARIVWPNGAPQAEFGVEVDGTIVAEQRLKGSCPWVFAFDGHEMRFVTDFLWRSPLGLRINAQDTATSQTEDWVRIGGDQLSPRDGYYDVRITAELWETHFFDHVSLMAIDHPEDTEVFIDERFTPQPASFAVQTLRGVRPVVRARDGNGRDVTGLVSRRDGRFLAAFERGRYQGIAGDHFVELEIDPTAVEPGGRPILVAHGWVYPTDSSINVAIAQGRHEQPRGLSLEYQDATGRWRLAEPGLGFPAGKNKTMLIDLRGTGGARRLRLRTNLEVSWDLLATGSGSSASLETRRMEAGEAELRYRGFSRTSSPRGDAPETPRYSPIASVGQRWRDLAGYYTRFGNVRDLLRGVDDRYVIMNAGDELALRFPAQPPVKPGWRRDFVLVGDGWEKDGDFNTEFSATVLPLPAHGARPYDSARSPGRLEDDAVYQRHRTDWEVYHTRYVSPESFSRGLGR
jgi:tetratricopeptide (TPR) repeat protein